MLETRSDLLEHIRLGEDSFLESKVDETPVARAVLADLDEPLWRRFAPAQTGDRPEVLLDKLAMVGRDEQEASMPSWLWDARIGGGPTNEWSGETTREWGRPIRRPGDRVSAHPSSVG